MSRFFRRRGKFLLRLIGCGLGLDYTAYAIVSSAMPHVADAWRTLRHQFTWAGLLWLLFTAVVCGFELRALSKLIDATAKAYTDFLKSRYW